MASRKISSPWGNITPHHMRDGRRRYRLRGTVDGEVRSCGVFDTIDEARAEARAMLEAEAPSAGALTLGAWGTRWLDKIDLEKRRTARDKRRVWDRYVAGSFLADMPLRKVRPEHVRRWLDDLARRTTPKGEPLADQTMKNAFYALCAGLRDAQAAGQLSAHPARGVRVVRRGTTDDQWTHLALPEIDRILSSEALPLRQRVIYGVAIYTGLRAGELWGLRWSDVALKGDEPHLTVRRSFDGPTKGGRTRRVPLFPPALALLTEWREAQRAERLAKPDRKRNAQPAIGALVWPSREGGMHAEGYDGEWAARYRERSGTRAGVTLRDMRHTFASHLIMGSWGRPWRLEEIQVLMGHRSRTTTERYAHLAPDSIRGAAQEATMLWVTSRKSGD